MASRPAAPPLLPRVAPDAEPVAPDASVERAHAWRPPWRAAAIVLGAWTLVALVGTQQALLSMWRNGEPLDWWPQLRWNLTSCWMWALFTPPMIWLARRYSFTDERRGAVLVHVIAALAFAALDAAITWALLPWLSKGLMAQQPTVATLFIRGLFINVTSYVCVVAVTSSQP